MKGTTGYEWAKRNKTQQLAVELAAEKKVDPKQYIYQLRTGSRNKFRAKKVEHNGYKFDSLREFRHYNELRLREKAGEICELQVHPEYSLVVNGVEIAKYKPDFEYIELKDSPERIAGRRVVDVKSPPTARKRDFVLVRKLMRACHGIDVEVIT